MRLSQDAPSSLTRRGSATMSPAMRTATRYARYLYSTLEPWLRWPVLEIGTGFGTYTRMLLDGGPVFSVDVDADCLRDVRASHAGNPLSTIQLDLNDHAAVRDLARLRFCSIFSTNVFEHLADDAGCLRALYDASESGCRIGLLVPAHPGLYGYMDRDAGHYRRYTRRSLTDAMAGVGWRGFGVF